jgi:hypothetical protein
MTGRDEGVHTKFSYEVLKVTPIPVAAQSKA